MSRVAKKPITIPTGVDVTIEGNFVTIKGTKGSIDRQVHQTVTVEQKEGELVFAAKNDDCWAQAGTERSLVNNMVEGVSKGYEKKLQLVGVGYRAQMKGQQLVLALGYSHDINFTIPEGISIEVPSQTEVVVKGIDKQAVGQAAAEIRAYRLPEPYKGKGVRYSDERVRRKEVKKS